MVSRYAVVCDGSVENVVLWDGASEWAPDDGRQLVALPDDHVVNPGDTYDGETFTASPMPVAMIPVEVDPEAVSSALAAAQVATTVSALRTAVVALAQQLQPPNGN